MGNFLFHSFENVYATDLCPWYIYPMMAGFRRMFFPGGVPPLLLLSLRAKSLRACFSFPSFIYTQPLLWQKQGLCIIFQKSTGHIFNSQKAFARGRLITTPAAVPSRLPFFLAAPLPAKKSLFTPGIETPLFAVFVTILLLFEFQYVGFSCRTLPFSADSGA